VSPCDSFNSRERNYTASETAAEFVFLCRAVGESFDFEPREMVGDLGHRSWPAERLPEEHALNEMSEGRRKIGSQRAEVRRAIIVLHFKKFREVVGD
jgi:hypothetical protein